MRYLVFASFNELKIKSKMENILPEKESDSDDEIPREILDKAERIFRDLLPNKSKRKYESAYNEFMAWLKTKKTTLLSEEILTVYFEYLLKELNMKPSTVWVRYSMLKLTIVYKKYLV